MRDLGEMTSLKRCHNWAAFLVFRGNGTSDTGVEQILEPRAPQFLAGAAATLICREDAPAEAVEAAKAPRHRRPLR